jgi:PiT family inorganic phosphate transporter
MSLLILIAIFIALVFDFINGFHDAANSIATVVSTGVLKPRTAVIWAAFFNFVAAFTFGVTVAMTVGKGVVHAEAITVPVILSGLIGAIIWGLITWWLGLPSSSSHALIGGLVGAAMMYGGPSLLNWMSLAKIAMFIVVAPVIGMTLGILNQLIVYLFVQNGRPRRMNQLFRKLQLVSSAIYSFSHGTNDAQKTMGIIFALLVAAKEIPPDAGMPAWVIFLCYGVISFGTLFGGFRIVRTMGTKLTKLGPMQGFCAETGGGVTILAVSHLGIPVSTTHTITGAIIGVGMTHGVKSVRWIIASRIVWAWILTIPMSALMAAIFFELVGRFLH